MNLHPASRPRLAGALLCAIAASAQAEDLCPRTADRSAWCPSTTFVQAGVGEDVAAVVAGATWAWPWTRTFSLGEATGHWEASFGRWEGLGANGGSAWVTQLGITPVLRLYPKALGHGLFAEIGIGVNLLAPVYRSEDKRFSTVFNFGDHLAVGKRFAGGGELSLRIQHFSNAGIRHPNPGENFVQVRYAWPL